MDLLLKFAFIACMFGLSVASKAGKLDEETKDLRNAVDEDTAPLEPSVSSNLYTALSQINQLRDNAQTTGLPAPKTIHRPAHKPHHVDTLPSLNEKSDVSKIVPSPTARVVIGQHEEVSSPREKRCFNCGNMGGNMGGGMMGNDLQPNRMGGSGFTSGSSSGSFTGFSESSGGASQADFARVLQAFGGGSASDAFSQQEFSRILNQLGSSGGFQSMGMSGGAFQGRSSLSQSEINQMLSGLNGMSGSGSSGQTTKGDFARILIQFDRSGGNLGSSGMSGSGSSFSGFGSGMSGSLSGSFTGMSESSGSASADFARILQMFGGGSTTDSFSQQDFSRVLNQMGSSGSSGMSGFSIQGKSSLSQHEINQLLAGITGMQGSGSSGQTTKGDFAKILIQYDRSGQVGSGMSGSRQKVIVQQPQQVFVVQPQPVDVVRIPIRIVSGGNDVQPDQVVQQQQNVNVNYQQQQQQQQYQQQQQQQQYQQQQYEQQQYQQQQYQQQQYQQQQQLSQHQAQNNKPVLTLINPNGGTMVYSTGSYTLQGAMQTEVKSGYTYTYSTYTKIIDATPTIGVITLVAMQTFYAGQLVPQGQNPYGVPNVGVFTLPGSMSAFQSNGYPFTVSSFTKIVDGVATYGAITLAGLQTYFNDKLLGPNENPYGVPNQGTYTKNGEMRPIQISGYPATVSTYTKIVDGVATYGTITLGSMQTFYNGKLLLPGQNPYGVPNEGTYTLAGQMSSFADNNGYPVTVSTYTKVINGRATFGTITKGTQMTMYDGRILRYGENIFGVPNEGIHTIPGGLSFVDVNGQTQTRTTITKVVNGQATYVTLTVMPMQTTYFPNDRGATMIMQGGSGGGVCELCGK